LSATASTSNATCSINPTGNITLEAQGGGTTYEYSIDGVNFQASPVFNVFDGSYVVSVRDNNGCIITINQVVGLTNDLFLNTRTDTTICFGGSIALTTNSYAGATFDWAGQGLSSSTSQSPVATPTSLGINSYTVTATLGRCTATDQVDITVNSQVQVIAGADQSIISGESVQLNGGVSGASNYLWGSNPSDATLTSTTILNPIATPPVTTTYTLTATNAAGCTASDDITVTVIPYCIKVKNAFSPNGDGVNDKWQIYDQYDCLSNITLTVFNRYGSKVFQSRDYRNNWDGTYNGKPCPDGTYYGVIEFKLISGKKFTKKTDITIIR
jgi:gliding motility-associated-like protein